MTMTYEQMAIVAAGLALLAVMIGTGAYAARLRRKHEAALTARELAVIVEESAPTGAGIVSMLMLIGTVGVSALIFVSAKSAIHEIEAAVILIAGAVIWGLGIALGRTRTYRVYRSEHREPM